MGRKLTNEQWIEKAIPVHGGSYSYSNTYYSGVANKVEIVCPIHGSFKQYLTNHLRGCGCPSCGIERTKGIEGMKARLEESNYGMFSYDFSFYTNRKSKILITCNKHNHSFMCKPNQHTKSKSGGCIHCQKEMSVKKTKKR